MTTFWRWRNFKTGIVPSQLTRMDMNKLTGTQKLTLTSARIFGEKIGGSMRSGNSTLRSKLSGPKRLARYDIPLWNIRWVVPWLRDVEDTYFKKELDDSRKLRNMMRGVKIGRKKGTGKMNVLNVFEKKLKEDPSSL